MVASPHGGQKEHMMSGKWWKEGRKIQFHSLFWAKSEEEMGSGWDVQRGNFSSQKGNIRACVPPLSHQIPLQWVRRGGFCLLDRLMRQGSRRKDSGQREVMVGSWFLLTLSRYPHLINWTWEQFVCLFRFVLGCARLSCSPCPFLYSFLSPSVWETHKEGDLLASNHAGVTDETRLVQSRTCRRPAYKNTHYIGNEC